MTTVKALSTWSCYHPTSQRCKTDWVFTTERKFSGWHKLDPTKANPDRKMAEPRVRAGARAVGIEGDRGMGGGRSGNPRTTFCLAAKGPSVGFQLLFCCCQIFLPGMTSEEVSGDVKYRNADRPVQCKHWVRPRSAQYSYLYDYRRNYYDDILDYLDRRRRGIIRDIPRPQTWAERALRTYTQKLGTTENAIKARYDSDLIHRVHHSRVMHDYHTKDYYSKRFTMAVF